jgi:hypothetical protein
MGFVAHPGFEGLEVDFINFEGRISSKDIESILADKTITRIQTNKPVKRSSMKRLNAELFSVRPDILLRLYSYWDKPCDLSFLELMPNLRRFSVDSVRSVSHIEAISQLPNLVELGIGALDLTDFNVLNQVVDSLNVLEIHQAKSKKPSLDIIERFGNLERLYIEGHCKGLEAIAGLTQLQDLTLRSVTSPNLDFISGLPELWSVDLKLGGTTNLAALAEVPNLKYLELWQIMKLDDLSVVYELKSLQNLFLESLKRVTQMPKLNNLTSLRRVMLQNMSGITDFTSLADAPSLEEFLLTDGKPAQADLLNPLFSNPNLKKASAYFGSDKRNHLFEAKATAHGLLPYNRCSFHYH